MGEALWRLAMLGGLKVQRGTHIPHFRSRKMGVLLAHLALYPERSFRREVLIDLLWPEKDPLQSAADFRNLLSRLQKEADGLLHIQRREIGLFQAACFVDVTAFRQEIQAALQRPADEERHLAAAVTLYQGPLLPEFDELWLEPERHRLENDYLNALRKLVTRMRAARRFEEALEYAERICHIDPYQEEPVREKIMLYLEMGRQLAARRVYQDYENLICENLGAPPSTSLQSLVASLKTGAPAVSLPLDAAPATTRFLGRDQELGLLADLLQASPGRLVTLIGPPGVGKTRLATECARTLTSSYPGGVVSVALAALNTEALDSLRVQLEARAHSSATSSFLAMLDNAEHLYPAIRHTVNRLREEFPTATFLVTSRIALGVGGEQVIALAPLRLPTTQLALTHLQGNPSLSLLLDRIQLVRPEFRLTAINSDVLVVLCHELEGLPLAIELAAPWLRLLDPVQLAQKIHTQRFQLLASTAPASDEPEAHQSLWLAIQSSYSLLSDGLKRLFRELSLFQGSWTVEAMEVVCSGPPTLLQLRQLMEASLVLVHEQAEGIRYTMLESLRQFAQECLTDEETRQWLNRLVAYFLGAVKPVSSPSNQEITPKVMQPFVHEAGNLHRALDWCLDPRSGLARDGLILATQLHPYWFWTNQLGEGQDYLARFLALPDNQELSAERAMAVSRALALAMSQGDTVGLAHWESECKALLSAQDTGAQMAQTLCALAFAEASRRAFIEARALTDRALAMSIAVGNTSAEMRARIIGAKVILLADGAPEDAEALLHPALDQAQVLALPQVEADALVCLARAATVRKDIGLAASYLERACVCAREGGNQGVLHFALQNLGWHYLEERDQPARAYSAFRESLLLVAPGGMPQAVATALIGLIGTFVRAGMPQDAAQTLGVLDSYYDVKAKSTMPTVAQNYAKVTGWLDEQGKLSSLSSWQEKGKKLTLNSFLERLLPEI